MSNKPKLNVEALKAAIKIAGGISNLAAKSDVSYQSIMDWKSGRRSPSVESCIKIEKALNGKISRAELLPDFPWNETKTVEKKDEKLEVAKNFLIAGVDINTISKATGISIEEIEKLEEKKDEKLEIAKNLLAAGVDINTISKTTGISVEELKNIKS